jgi:hypothetical protein
MTQGRTLSEKDLRLELDGFGERYPKLEVDDLFLLWFLGAYITENEEEAIKAITGGPKDKDVDAVLIDDRAKIVYLAQGKYRRRILGKGEKRNDVTGFAEISNDLFGPDDRYASLVKDMDGAVRDRLDVARERLRKRGYRLKMYYVTLGRCSESLRQEAERIVKRADGEAYFEVFDGRRVLLLFKDYLDGVAPPVPLLDLEVESGQGVRSTGVMNRFDIKTEIESWVFSMAGQAVGDLYTQAGDRLFARNIRGFLGSTEVNQKINQTLEAKPERFWYYNNGVTIVCDDARPAAAGGKNILRVANPQVINGQQTTRELHRSGGESRKASVLVRVIKIPRDPRRDSSSFEDLVSQIVVATNFQNEIRASDLRSNDRRQIAIERGFRKHWFHYLRKRKTKSEAKRLAGKNFDVVRKEDIAQAVAACDMDSSIVRTEGREGLFENRYYGSVFPTYEPLYYLTRVTLMRYAAYVARGHWEWGFAKWLVLHFLWGRMQPLVRGRAAAEAFIESWWNSPPSFFALVRAAETVYPAAIRYYRKRRGNGAKEIDITVFFGHRKRDAGFERYWASSRDPSVAKFKKRFTVFRKHLRREAEG